MPQNTNPFLNALEENENIQGLLKSIIHDVFDEMYFALGKLNFLRWVDKNFPERIKKELVIEQFNEDDKKEHPKSLGFYAVGKNLIKLLNFNDRRSGSHELLHYATDGIFVGPTFPTFINEGITEYINRELEKINNNFEKRKYSSYQQNVAFVEFLHKIIGDSLIKAYFTGTSEQFKKEFSTYLSLDGAENLSTLTYFYAFLEEIHKYLYAEDEMKDEEKKEQQKKFIEKVAYPKLRECVKSIIVNSVRKKAYDLQYYREGKVDGLALKKDIIKTKEMAFEILGKTNIFGMEKKLDIESYEFEESIIRDTLEAVIQECGFNMTVAIEIASNATKRGTIQQNEYSIIGTPPTIDHEKINSMVNGENINEVALRLMQLRFTKNLNYMQDGIFNISTFLMDAALVLDKLGVEGVHRMVLLDSVILRFVPTNVDKEFVKEMIDRNERLYVELYKKQQEAIRNVTENKFVKINDNLFVEKRDNTFFLLRYDDIKGAFLEEILYPQDIDVKMRFSKEQKEKFGDSVRRITFEDRSKQQTNVYSLYFDEDFIKVGVNGKKLNVMYGINGLAESYLIDEAMHNLMSNILNKSYVTFLQDGENTIKGVQYTQDIDDSTRIINFRAFAEELKNAVSRLPTQYHEYVANSAISHLIERTYGEFEYDITQIRQLITRDKFLTSDINEYTKLELLKITEELNQRRREEVKERRKICSVYFSDAIAKERYYENGEKKQERASIRALNQKVKKFVLEDAMECIVEPLEVRSDEEHFSTIAGVRYANKRRALYRTAAAKTVNYTLFVDSIKKSLEVIPEEQKGRFLRRALDESIRIWYGEGEGYPGYEAFLDAREIEAEEIKYIISEHILNKQELELDLIREHEEALLVLCEQEEMACNKLLGIREPIGYEDQETKSTYDFLKLIHDGNMYPDDVKKVVIDLYKQEHEKRLGERRKMSTFASIALAGDRPPSPDDIKKATRILGVDKENELGE